VVVPDEERLAHVPRQRGDLAPDDVGREQRAHHRDGRVGVLRRIPARRDQDEFWTFGVQVLIQPAA